MNPKIGGDMDLRQSRNLQVAHDNNPGDFDDLWSAILQPQNQHMGNSYNEDEGGLPHGSRFLAVEIGPTHYVMNSWT